MSTPLWSGIDGDHAQGKAFFFFFFFLSLMSYNSNTTNVESPERETLLDPKR